MSCSDSGDRINERSGVRRPIGNMSHCLLENINRHLLGNINRRLPGNMNRHLLGNMNRSRLVNPEMRLIRHMSEGYWAETVLADGDDVA